MTVFSRRSGATAILEPSGRLAAGAVDEFRSKWMQTLGDESVHNIAVNLGRVTMVDSSGIGTMIRCHSGDSPGRQDEDRGRQCHGSPGVQGHSS
jgi:hypothetical protein